MKKITTNPKIKALSKTQLHGMSGGDDAIIVITLPDGSVVTVTANGSFLPPPGI